MVPGAYAHSCPCRDVRSTCRARCTHMYTTTSRALLAHTHTRTRARAPRRFPLVLSNARAPLLLLPQAKFGQYVATLRGRGISLTDSIMQRKAFRNPDFLQKLVEHFNIQVREGAEEGGGEVGGACVEGGVL